MKINHSCQKNTANTFLIEINDYILEQIQNNNSLQIQEGQSLKDQKNYAYLLTKEKTFEIYKKELTNQLLVCDRIQNNIEIYSLQDKVLQLKEIEPNFKQIMMYLENLKLEDLKKNQLPTLDQICEKFIISKLQLIEFLQQKNIYVQDEIIYFLNEDQLFTIFVNFLGSLKTITKSFENIDTNLVQYTQMHNEFSNKYGSQLTQFLVGYFFTQNNDNTLHLSFDTVLQTLVFDMLNKSKEFFYVEFIAIMDEALKLCYPIQQYLQEIKPKLQTEEYIIQVQNLIKQRGIIKDYNEYSSSDCSLWSEENLKMLVNNYKNIGNMKNRLNLLKIHKDIFTREELNIYFKDLYPKQSQFESFIKKGFQKVFEEIHLSKIDKFKKYHPVMAKSLQNGMNKNQQSVMLYKIKTIWL